MIYQKVPDQTDLRISKPKGSAQAISIQS